MARRAAAPPDLKPARELFGKNNIPFAFFALTGICTVGLYLAYIIPVYLRLRKGDDFEPGPWNVNYTPLAIVLPLAFGLWYLVSAKDRYQGPVRTLEEDEITAG